MPLFPALITALTASETPRETHRRLQELASRLAVPAPRGELPSRLTGIAAQYGKKTLQRVVAVLRFQNIPVTDDGLTVGVRATLPWLARVVHAEPVEVRLVPTLERVSLWARTTSVDLLPLPLLLVAKEVERWTSDVESRVQALVEAQLLEGPRAAVLAPWLFQCFAEGEEGPWPDLVYLSDWVMNDQAAPVRVLSLSLTGAVNAATVWHGGTGINEEVWSAWAGRVRNLRAQSWAPLAGRVVKRWPNGVRVEQLEESLEQLEDESRVMDHCVGRGGHGNAYWEAVLAWTTWIWSLRIPDGYPVATIEVIVRHGVVQQVRQVYGPKNSPIHPAYKVYVFELLGPYLKYLPEHLQLEYLLLYARRGHPTWDQVLTVPTLAYKVAQKEGPRDDTRKAASADAYAAILYAQNIDKGPHQVTRVGACASPSRAIEYAVGIDKGPTEETRKAASATSRQASQYAEQVDKGPTLVTYLGVLGDLENALKYLHRWQGIESSFEDDIFALSPPHVVFEYAQIHPVWQNTERLRRRCLETPWSAFLYGTQSLGLAAGKMLKAIARELDVEEASLAVEATKDDPELRAKAYEDSRVAYLWDVSIAGGPTDAGREAASVLPYMAYNYAEDLDLGWHPVTREGVLRGADASLQQVSAELPGLPWARSYPRAWRGQPGVNWTTAYILAHYATLPPSESWPVEPDYMVLDALEALDNQVSTEAFGEAVSHLLVSYPALLVDRSRRSMWVRRSVMEQALDTRNQGSRWASFLPRFKELLTVEPALRRTILRLSPGVASGIVRWVDKTPSPDAMREVLKSPSCLIDVVQNLNLPFESLSVPMRQSLGKGGSNLARLYGYREFEFERNRGGWGHGSSQVDPVEKPTERILSALYDSMVAALRPRMLRAAAVDQVLYLAAEKEMADWVRHGSQYEPPGSFLSFARKVDPHYLSWYESGFYGYRMLTPEVILDATVKGVQGLPAVLYIPLRGRKGNGDGVHATEWASERGVSMRGGATMENAGPQVQAWYDGLTKRERSLVERRLPYPNGRPLLERLAPLWMASTVPDAELESRSPLASDVVLGRSALLYAIPWVTPRKAVGWLCLYPAAEPREAQVSVNARGKVYTRWTIAGVD